MLRSDDAAGQEEGDRELVRAFLEQRSERAFRLLYRRHSPRLYPLLLRLRGRGRGDAEDILQETWLRAARSLARFRFESELRTWLASIALNVCRERERSRKATLDAQELDENGIDEGPVEPIDGSTRMDLEQAIGGLPAGYRQVLLLHDLEGYTHREIAGLLDIEEGTSKSQLARARATLRRRLDVSRVGAAAEGEPR